MIQGALLFVSYGLLIGVSGCDRSIGTLPIEATSHTDKQDRKNTQILEIQPAKLDAGLITMGNAADLKFQLTNRGTSAIHMDSITTSCGCTKAIFEKSELAPRESTTLSVSVTPGESGPGAAAFGVFGKDSNGRIAAAGEITWIAEYSISVEPAIVHFGKVGPQGKSVRGVSLQTVVGAPIQERLVSVTCRPTTLLSVNQKKTSTGCEVEITLKVVEDSTAPESSGKLMLTLRDPAETIEIPVDWEIEVPVRIEPSQVFGGESRPGEIVRRTIVVQSTSRNQFEVCVVPPSIDPKNSEFTILKQTTPRPGLAVLDIRWRAPSDAGPYVKTIQLSLASENELLGVAPLKLAGSVRMEHIE